MNIYAEIREKDNFLEFIKVQITSIIFDVNADDFLKNISSFDIYI